MPLQMLSVARAAAVLLVAPGVGAIERDGGEPQDDQVEKRRNTERFKNTKAVRYGMQGGEWHLAAVLPVAPGGTMLLVEKKKGGGKQWWRKDWCLIPECFLQPRHPLLLLLRLLGCRLHALAGRRYSSLQVLRDHTRGSGAELDRFSRKGSCQHLEKRVMRKRRVHSLDDCCCCRCCGCGC